MGRLKKTLSITLDPELYNQLDQYCKDNKVGRTEFIETLLGLIFNADDLVTYSKSDNPMLSMVATLTMTQFYKLFDRLSEMIKAK